MSEERISWKDSNLALIGSELDHKVKEAAADGEVAWDGIGEKVELKIWRIEKFHVVEWPEEKYGEFHTGDSYIVLNTYLKDPDNNSEALIHDIHIWIGLESSQDEYGTAAYKMVECDDSLGGVPIEHREVQGHESKKFLSYFSSSIKYLIGGVETGFNHVEPTIDDPNLYRVKKIGKNTMSLTQLPLSKSSLNQGDSFILYDGSTRTWVWHGESAQGSEKFKANTVAESMCTEGTVTVLESSDEDEDFWNYLGDGDIQDPSEEEGAVVSEFVPILYKLSADPDEAPEEIMKADNPITSLGEVVSESCCFDKSLLDDTDVFLLDCGWEIFIWIGNNADKSEKIHAVAKGQNYTKNDPRTMSLPMTLLKSGQEEESSIFNAFFN